MNEDKQEVDKFFEELPSEDKTEADIFDEKPKLEAKAEVKIDAEAPEKEEEGDGRKNRRHRRLEEKLQAEREANIALNERIKALSEVAQFQKDYRRDEEIDPDLIKVFGDNDTGKEIARIMEKREEMILSRAEERALERLKAAQEEEEKEVAKYESAIESQIEAIEDKYDVDLTSGTKSANQTRTEFLNLLSALSPKDEEGNITNYADFDSTFEVYQSTKQKPDASRNKELASRSNQKSGPISTQKTEDDATKAYLRKIGLGRLVN